MSQPPSEYSKLLILTAIALFLGGTFTILFYGQGVGLNVPLFVILISCCGLLLARVFSHRIDRTRYALILLALFFSSMVFVHASMLLTFFNIVGSVLLLLMVIDSFTGKRMRAYLPLDYIKVIILPLRFIEPFFKTLPEIFSLRRVFRGHSATKEIVRGIVMSIIAIIIFALLFASADAVFHKVVSSIFTFQLNDEFVSRLVLCLIVTACFVGAFAFMFKKLHGSTASDRNDNPRELGAVETTILLGSINVLFFIFIVLQLAYLFGGESHLLSAGATYAEYARKGFFELNLVAILSYLVVSFVEKRIIKKEAAHSGSFKILSGVLVAQVIIILISAFTRLSLYEDAYGFTTIRLYSHAFMIWLGVVLVLLSHHIWTNGNRATFVFRTFCTIVLLLFAMNVINPDVFIARKNLERYVETGHIDATYLGRLSDDALPYTIHLRNDPNEEVRKGYVDALRWQHDNCPSGSCLGPGMNLSWQSAHLHQKKAEQLKSAL